MKKLIGLMLAVMLLAAAAATALAEEPQGTVMYVYTENGKGLYVRSSMSTKEDNIVGSLPYGAKVFTYGSPQAGWIYIDYGDDFGDHYVMSRYLVKLASAKPVTPYTITVRPTRASGWVYMRWLPSRNAAQAATYGANQQLTVLAELKDWYQVQDPATGRVGFIYKSYIQ